MSLERLLEIKEKLPKVYRERLIFELDVITNNGIENFLPYFITLADIVQEARRMGILVGPGRGSAGGSLVAYLLGITSVDPIRYNLPFSRFLSKKRLLKSVPDIDLDFEVNHLTGAHRDKLNEYIFNKYGDRAAQIATFGLLKLKASLLDSWRINVLQPTESAIKQLRQEGKLDEAKLAEANLAAETAKFNDVRKTLGNCPVGYTDLEWLEGCEKDDAYEPGLLETNKIFKDWADQYPKVLETATNMLGVVRSMGKHAAGIVIADRPLYEICPVMKVDGVNVIAYDKKEVAKLGLIKNDNLGLTALNFIGDTIKLIKTTHGIELDPWELPEDPKVYSLFGDGKCLSIFQFETAGGANFAKKLGPKRKEDIYAATALNRPGSLDALITLKDGSQLAAADVYIGRKNGELPIEYLHPDLEPILKERLGVLIYQEDIMQILQKLLGFSEEDSDQIRAAISDKNPEAFKVVEAQLPLLKARGWSDGQISELYQQMVAFARYSFNLAHSVEYGLITYCTDYLKYYYPKEWWSAVLSHSTPDEVTEKYWSETAHFVSEPDVNLSTNRYVYINNKLAPPLDIIQGVGEKALENIAKNAPYSSFDDFLGRIDSRAVNKKTVINLLKGGALNSLLPAGLSLEDKVSQYIAYKVLADYNLKRAITPEIMKRHFDKEMPPELIGINPYHEYLICKQVLPVSTLKLSEAVLNTPSISKSFLKVVKYLEGKEFIVDALRGALQLVDGFTLNEMYKNIHQYTMSSLEFCCYGYVSKARKFAYFNEKLNMHKQAIELILDFDGYQISTVCWASKHETVPKIASMIKEQTAYLFKIKLQNHAVWRFSVAGLEEIKIVK